MTRVFCRVISVLFFFCAINCAAFAEKRVALVIGNSDYKLISALRNPVNDARLMADTLREVGFDVVEAQNASRADMVRAMREFGKRLSAGGRDAVGLFYYAGHGVQALNSNFLLPLNAVVETEEDLELETVDTQWVLRQMERAGNKLNIVVLDACRNNPFKGSFRSASRGLSRINAPSGSLIAYSAAPGQVAADGDAAHSPYTAALAKAIKQPGSELIKVFRQTRIAVEAQTGGSQTPWEEQSLKADFYFLPGSTAIITTPSATPDAAAWRAIQNTDSKAVLEAFIKEFPDGVYAKFAKARLKETEVAAGVFPEQPQEPPPKTFKPGHEFRDCDGCPEMVVIPVGSFMMGSPANEEFRKENEGPQHVVAIPNQFSVGKYEVTVIQFEAFVRETGHDAGNECYISLGLSGIERRAGHNFRNPGFSQNGDHPVVCVSLEDVKAYLVWLSLKTGRAYRLLSEAEWEFAARAGTTTPFHFGNSEADACLYANGADRDSPTQLVWRNPSCSDGTGNGTAEVGHYTANRFGLHDMHGNVWEAVADCWSKNYHGTPTDGSSHTIAPCVNSTKRGGSWFDAPDEVRSASRRYTWPNIRSNTVGFRVGRTLAAEELGQTGKSEQPKPKTKVAIGVFPEQPQEPAKETFKSGDEFRDCDRCPEMVVVPAGSFIMGSPADEKGRSDDEGPQHKVKIPKPLAVGRFEVTRAQFEDFVRETGHDSANDCTIKDGASWTSDAGHSFRNPGFAQDNEHPVVCVYWSDAKAYVTWLSKRTKKDYRLLSEAEWEYAVRAGTTTRFHFGNSDADLCDYANVRDASIPDDFFAIDCNDGVGEKTAAVGQYMANNFGLYDMHGNVKEWVEDCWNDTYHNAPADGSSRATGICGLRVLRGGSWLYPSQFLRSAKREAKYGTVSNIGFRVARTLTP